MDTLSISPIVWTTDNPSPKGTLVIIHGMMEHAQRYRDVAHYLNRHGYTVLSINLPGHGKKARLLGHLPKKGWQLMVQHTHELVTYAQSLHPNKPVFVLGHSMGSYIAQTACIAYQWSIQGLILSGTSYEPPFLTLFGKWFTRGLLFFRSAMSHSPLVNHLVFGQYNTRLPNPKTPYDWLSRDPNIVHDYIQDPLCGFPCSIRFFHQLFSGLHQLYQAKYLNRFPIHIPLHFISGTHCPLGKQTKQVKQLITHYKANGHQSITHHFYPEARHECLNETNRLEIFQDLLSWINKQING